MGTSNGLYQLDPKTAKLNQFKHVPTDEYSLSHDQVLAINIDTRGAIWIGTAVGLNRFNEENGRFTRYKYQPAERHSLSGNRVNVIHQDSKGNIWFGTQTGGVSTVNPRLLRFGHFKHDIEDSKSLSGSNVMSVFQDATGALWVGTRWRGLNKMNILSDGFKRFKHDPDNLDSISNNAITSILESPVGNLWIATYGGGLNQYDVSSSQFIHFNYDKTDLNSLSDDLVKSLYIDKEDTFWVGTLGGGLNKFDRQNKRFKYYRHQVSDRQSISDDNVTTMFEDSKGRFWVGTRNGLNLLDRKNGRFTRYRHDEQNPNGLSNNNIAHIQQDSTGTLWFATYGGGLNKYNEQTDSFTSYRVKDGLPNDTIYAILEDNAGFLWLSTNFGLSKFNPITEIFKNYDANDGLQSNEFNRGVQFKSKSGELFFGGINGFNRFFPENIKDDTVPPKVVFTDFLLYNKSVVINPIFSLEYGRFTLPKAIGALPELTLGHQQAIVTFEFAALDYASPGKNQYKYKLEGFDKNWIEADAQYRRATYTSLPSGDYTLRVKAANPDGYWNEQGASIKIHVNPSPWFSWWAYVTYVILILWFVVVARQYRLQKINLYLERKVRNQMQQVDKLKDAFLANTSHELRTPLNGIIGLAESLIDGVAGQLPAKANKNLSMVVTSGKRLAHLINDILDLSKLKHRNIVLNTQSLDLHSLVEVVLVLSEPLLAGKDLRLVNAVPNDLTPVEADENRLLQIMHNLVGNGIKFTDSGTVTVTANTTDNGVTISVIDTGIGISEGKFSTIFDSFEQVEGDSDRAYGGTGLGLTITRQLVELHAGSIEVVSYLGEGSTFSFTLPIAGAKPATGVSAGAVDVFETVNETLHLETLHLETIVPSTLVDEPVNDDTNVVYDNVDPARDGSKFRLLLVDDEPINLQVLNNYLSMQNYQLVEAVDGLQALQAIEQAVEQDAPFDMVLLDIMMPKMSGYEVCRKIRLDHDMSDLPVIFLTAKNQIEDLVQGFAVGANDHLIKPVSKSELLSRVETHLKLLDAKRVLKQKNQEIVEAQQYLDVDLLAFKRFIFELAGDNADEAILNSFTTKFTPLYDHLDTIKNGTERIKTIVQDLKVFSQLGHAEQRTVVITECLQSTMNLVRTKNKAVAEFITDFKDKPELLCYPAQLNQVFMNLIVNACDTIRDKLRQQNLDKPGQVTVGCQCLGEHIEITVKDNGCGMTDETKNKLFEPFYTTKDVGEGTGLGLSISYGIVQKHDGELRVESVLGQGTVFRVILPV
ncbi:MAG: response regulator [Algicola sp.]|nr:response regulator [Algicola sp.]